MNIQTRNETIQEYELDETMNNSQQQPSVDLQNTTSQPNLDIPYNDSHHMLIEDTGPKQERRSRGPSTHIEPIEEETSFPLLNEAETVREEMEMSIEVEKKQSIDEVREPTIESKSREIRESREESEENGSSHRIKYDEQCIVNERKVSEEIKDTVRFPSNMVRDCVDLKK